MDQNTVFWLDEGDFSESSDNESSDNKDSDSNPNIKTNHKSLDNKEDNGYTDSTKK